MIKQSKLPSMLKQSTLITNSSLPCCSQHIALQREICGGDQETYARTLLIVDMATQFVCLLTLPRLQKQSQSSTVCESNTVCVSRSLGGLLKRKPLQRPASAEMRLLRTKTSCVPFHVFTRHTWTPCTSDQTLLATLNCLYQLRVDDVDGAIL